MAFGLPLREFSFRRRLAMRLFGTRKCCPGERDLGRRTLGCGAGLAVEFLTSAKNLQDELTQIFIPTDFLELPFDEGPINLNRRHG